MSEEYEQRRPAVGQTVLQSSSLEGSVVRRQQVARGDLVAVHFVHWEMLVCLVTRTGIQVMSCHR